MLRGREGSVAVGCSVCRVRHEMSGPQAEVKENTAVGGSLPSAGMAIDASLAGLIDQLLDLLRATRQ